MQPQLVQSTPATSQMMSVIAQAPPMSTPASVIQHPPSSLSPQPPRQTATPPPPTSQSQVCVERFWSHSENMT